MTDLTTASRKKESSRSRQIFYAALIPVAAAVLGYFGKYIFSQVNILSEKMTKLETQITDMRADHKLIMNLREDVASMRTTIDELNSRQINEMWKDLAIFNEKIEEIRIKLGVLDVLYGRNPYASKPLRRPGTNENLENEPANQATQQQQVEDLKGIIREDLDKEYLEGLEDVDKYREQRKYRGKK